MNPDNQHLDFLISQYVDGTLEGAGKKSVEQQLLTDPAARQLYTEHREVQDLLDDLGSRIPLVNWNEFDALLETRLDVESHEKRRQANFRRRLRPLAAAAALIIAATFGYGWHAWSHQKTATLALNPATTNAPGTPVIQATIHAPAETTASYAGIQINEQPMQNAGTVEGVALNVPSDQMALQALQANVQYGLGFLPNSSLPTTPRGMVVGAHQATNAHGADEPDTQR
jgi:hypothetical protein